MNLLKKYIWLAAGLGTALILLAASGARLFFVLKSYQKEKRELNDDKVRIEQLYQRRIFPSEANIAREKEKQADLVDAYNELNDWLSAGQVRPAEMEAAEFMPFLENTLRRIRDQLQSGRVVFPEKYTFGFEKYAGGQLPLPKNIPRLVQQLKMTEEICRLLPDSAVSELISFARDEFESVAEGAAPPGAPPPETSAEDDFISSQHFKIEFRAREGSAFDFINRLARLPMFTVITRVEINNPRRETTMTGAAPKSGAEKSPAAVKGQTDETARDKRIVLGREDVEIKLDFEVYNFGPPIDFREGRN
ncbi:MAG: Amuc_1100 family pilus-like protein [Kiritimatiellae bacterium]|nr:Amuc_1100 family pilus-like protein [Kiritimatiellia bacterium]